VSIAEFHHFYRYFSQRTESSAEVEMRRKGSFSLAISCYSRLMDYESVNAMPKNSGREPITEPQEGSEKEKLQHLLDVYTDQLIAASSPQYASIPREKFPDMIVQGLRAKIAEL
jgi:hypothetical protein